MNERFISLVLLCGLLLVAAVSPAASAGGCSSDDAVNVRKLTRIRAAPHTSAAYVRYAAEGERLEDINSIRTSVGCWLQTNEGWLIIDPLVQSAPLIETGDTQRSECFRGNTAHITGLMNIRAAASASSAIVGNARAGESFAILETRLGRIWCWLRISLGWLANTSRVQSTDPVQSVSSPALAPQPVERSDIDNCCFVNRHCTTDQEWEDGYWAYQRNECPGAVKTGPSTSSRFPVRIEGSPKFVRGVESTLAVMKMKAPRWYEYVVGAADAIIEVLDEPDRFTCWAHARAGSRSIWAEVCMFYPPWEYGSVSPIDGAAMLSHEACHLRGDDFVPATGEYDHDLCRKAARDAQAAIRGYTG